MTNAYVLTGTLVDGRTVTLDEPLPVVAGRVRLTVEVADLQAAKTYPSGADFSEKMEAIWEEQRRRGHVPPTPDEVRKWVQSERDSWGDEE